MDTAEFRGLLQHPFGGAHLALNAIARRLVTQPPFDPWADADPHVQITDSSWHGQTMALPIYGGPAWT